MGLTIEALEALRAPFAPDEHEFLKGNAYITEAAILDRIEGIDPSWEGTKTEVVVRDNPNTKQTIVTVFYRLTICGVSRESDGTAAVALTKNGDNEANEAEKSALTDAIKRAARLFGIGRYLLSLPNEVKDVNSMARYLGVNTSSAGNPTASNDRKPWVEDRERVVAFFDMAKTEFGMDGARVLEIMNKERGTTHSRFSEFGDTLPPGDATAIVIAYGCSHNADEIDLFISKQEGAFWQSAGNKAKEIF